MKTLPRIKSLKIIAVCFFCITFGVTVASIWGFSFSVKYKYFEYPKENNYLESLQLADDVKEKLHEFSDRFCKNTNDFFEIQPSNIVVTVQDSSGKSLYSDINENVQYLESSKQVYETPDGKYIFTAYAVLIPMEKDILYYSYHIYDFMYNMRYIFAILMVTCGSISLFLIYFIICGAGRKWHSNELYFTMADNITFDVYLSLLAGMQILMCYIIYLAAMEFAYWTLFVICPCLLAIAAITVACISTVAKRVKKGKWWENTVIYAVGCFAWLLICRMSKVLEKLIENISTVWKVIAGAAAYLIITVVVSNAKNGIITTVWIIMSVVVLAVICLGVLAADKLQKGAEKIARGDFEYQIDTHDLTLEFKRHAENLNKINQALSKAVDERTKSERFKAELITNVSHDIKTPLTSIINYVDLLKKLNIDSETAEQYIEVLDRQSARLKKLTLDLVEASKASTGNITVNFSPTDICELLLQSTGEYAEKFERAELELILDLPNDHIVISADGSLMWRVFDNILSNITKYAQSCTRVYISAEKSENNIVITFKNISREKLNVSSAELTERFVRGDSARSTEGSGLGLSIAKSFVELQNGNLEVMVDGDLFKITIIL